MVDQLVDNQLLTLDQDIQNANKVKRIVIASLIENGYISREDGHDFIERYQVIIYKNSWFIDFIKKFLPDSDPKGYRYQIVEMQRKPIVVKETK
jgi:hypothetical protein